MPFVNEFIPAEDVEKYNLKEIDEKFAFAGTKARDWTIDRERDIYLRNVAIGAGNEPELSSRTTWTFYWHGTPLTLRLDLLEGSGEKRGEPGWAHWRLVWLNGSNGLPENLRPHKTEILADLEDALLAYGDFGVYSTSPEFSITLDIAEECVL